ncbi:MAG TPA: hypothetical protein VHE82_10075 [Gemmatimonadaceae bacterium]|nr:hypothetical protein [Gemmatimonadaceae bacterium]
MDRRLAMNAHPHDSAAQGRPSSSQKGQGSSQPATGITAFTGSHGPSACLAVLMKNPSSGVPKYTQYFPAW